MTNNFTEMLIKKHLSADIHEVLKEDLSDKPSKPFNPYEGLSEELIEELSEPESVHSLSDLPMNEIQQVIYEDFLPDGVCDYDKNRKATLEGEAAAFMTEGLVACPPDAKQFAFQEYLTKLESIRNCCDKVDEALGTSEALAGRAMQAMLKFHEDITGYDAWWVFTLYEKAVLEAHRKKAKKFTASQERTNGLLIRMLEERGASATQSAKLVLRLYGAKKLGEDAEDPIMASYRKFEQELPKGANFSDKDALYRHIDSLPRLLLFRAKENIFNDSSKPAKKALAAFEKLCGEIIEIIQESGSYSQERDAYELWNSFEGSAIDKLYNNPLYDFFNKNAYTRIGDWIAHIDVMPD